MVIDDGSGLGVSFFVFLVRPLAMVDPALLLLVTSFATGVHAAMTPLHSLLLRADVKTRFSSPLPTALDSPLSKGSFRRNEIRFLKEQISFVLVVLGPSTDSDTVRF